MKYHFNTETRTFTVECDNNKQCKQLSDFLDELSQAYHLIYTYVPSSLDDCDDSLMQCFESLDEAKKAAHKERDFYYRMGWSPISNHYTFYEMPLDVWEHEVCIPEDNARVGKKVATMYVHTNL